MTSTEKCWFLKKNVLRILEKSSYGAMPAETNIVIPLS